MTVLLWFYVGALVGLSVFLLCERWREESRRLDEQVADGLADIDFERWEQGR